MNIFRLVLSNLKRYIKSPMLILPMVFMPAVLSLVVIFGSGSSDGSIYMPKVAVVGDLDGKYESKLIDELNSSTLSFNSKDKESALDLLKENEVSAVFVLEDNFSASIDNIQKPKVEVIKIQEGGGSILAESIIDTFINDSIKSNITPNIDSKLVTAQVIKDESLIPSDDIIVVFMISYCLYVCAASFGKDLIDLRSANVLRRMISTKNKDFEIIFSIFFALFLVQSISCVITLLGLNLILGFEISFYSILVIVANCFVSTGFVIALTRIFKTETGVSLGSVFYSLASVALYIPTIIPSLQSDIRLFNNLVKLSPVYWTFEAMKGNSLILNLLALILIGLAFITAGSFKLKDFAKN